jgi:hypothetical protein
MCGSHSGEVFKYKEGRTLFNSGGWCRGLAVSQHGIWVGNSPMANMEDRALGSGEVCLFDPKTYENIKVIKLPKSGQVHDLLLI